MDKSIIKGSNNAGLMRKILTFFVGLLIALSVGGCSKSEPVFKDMLPASDNKADYLTFLDTRWGMNLEETCKALSLEKAKLIKDTINPMNPERKGYLYENYTFRNLACELYLEFKPSTEQNPVERLNEVYILCDSTVAFDEAYSYIKELYGAPDNSKLQSSLWKSKKLVGDVLTKEQAEELGRIKAESMLESKDIIEKAVKNYPKENLAMIAGYNFGEGKPFFRFYNLNYTSVNNYLSNR